MKKILILGISGSGKTTLAKALEKDIKVPVYHLDFYFWKPEWTMPEEKEWRETIGRICEKESWIIDGNYSSVYNLLIPSSEIVIVLEVSRIRAIFRTLLRTFRFYGAQREDVGNGCVDRFDWEFIKYIWNFKNDRLPILEDALSNFGKGKKILRFSGKISIKDFLETVRKEL